MPSVIASQMRPLRSNNPVIGSIQSSKAFMIVLIVSDADKDNVCNRFSKSIAPIILSSSSMTERKSSNLRSVNCLDLAIWQLKAVMGVDLDARIGVVGNIDQYKNDMLAFITMSENISLDNNSALVQMQMQEQQIDRTVKMTKYHYIPTLAASFSYNYMAMGDDFKFKWYPYSVVGLSLNIPIFDGFSTSSKIRQYKASKNIIQLNREDTERNLKITLKNYENQINTCMKNYAAAESTLEMAQRSYDIAERMYDLGKATLLELNDAQLALVQAQLTMSQAVYNFMVTKSSIEELEGNEFLAK